MNSSNETVSRCDGCGKTKTVEVRFLYNDWTYKTDAKLLCESCSKKIED